MGHYGWLLSCEEFAHLSDGTSMSWFWLNFRMLLAIFMSDGFESRHPVVGTVTGSGWPGLFGGRLIQRRRSAG
ncbi:hypothetical protein [Kitasatospora sp. NPDC058190]|uniref:hypothetical protein n=1 Tax=Kitasatospora sp. NPDC058190 TaxID=3346371 RepID=UPI0036DA5D78